MNNTQMLEQYWLDLVLNFQGAHKLNGAFAISYPKTPLFAMNHVTDIQVPSINLLHEAEAFFRSQKVPFVCFRISPLAKQSTFASVLKKNGFSAQSNQSVMVYGKKASPELPNNQEASIKIAQSVGDIEVASDLMIEIFEMPPQWKQGFMEVNVECFRKGWRFYLAYVEGEAVGTCALFSSQGVGGIFNVGTLPRFRGHGIGSALTVKALLDSVAEGNRLHSLQAECGGKAEQLYLKLGFVVDHNVQFFAKDIPYEG